MQTTLLAAYPAAAAGDERSDIRGFVVWLPMYPGDAKSRWPPDILTDARFLHRWDEPKAIGRLLRANVAALGPRADGGAYRADVDAVWDAYLLYRPGARWTGTLPDGLVSWGSTIMRTRTTLATDLAAIAPPRR